MSNTEVVTINTSPEHFKCLFCIHTNKLTSVCKANVGRPMKKEITALWGAPPWETWETRPDQHFYCKLYQRDKNKIGYQK